MRTLISSLAFSPARISRMLIGLVALFALTVGAKAVVQAPFTIKVNFSSQIHGSGSATLSVFGESTATAPATITTGGVAQSSVVPATLKPFQIYTVSMASTSTPSPSSYELSFVAPDGYIVFINGNPANYQTAASLSGTYTNTYTLEVRPASGTVSDFATAADLLGFGMFSGIQLGKSVSWSIGLGKLQNGRSAGRIQFDEADLSSTTNPPNARARLFYSPPPSYSQTSTFKDGPSSQTLRQVNVPLGMVDIVDNGTAGYWFKFYQPSQIEWSPGNPAILHGSPWKTIYVEQPAANQLKITETEGTVSYVYFVTAPSAATGTYTWTQQEGDGTTWLRTTTHASVNNGGSPATRDDTVTVRTGGTTGTVVAVTKFHYTTKAWDEVVTSVTADPATLNLTTSYTYNETSTATGNYGRVRSITAPNGMWTAWQYYDDLNRRGQLQYEFHPAGNLPATVPATLDPTQGRVISYDYAADWSGRYTRPISVIETINNATTHKATTTNTDTVGSGWQRETATTSNYRTWTFWQISSFQRYRGDAGLSNYYLPYDVRGANYSDTAYSYGAGSFDTGTKAFIYNSVGAYLRILAVHGTTVSTGAEALNIWTGQSFNNIYLVVNKSTMDVTINDIAGNAVRTESYVYTGSGNFALISSTDMTYDYAGRPLTSIASNGATVENTYTNGTLDHTIDATGTETDYTYDVVGRTWTVKKKGVALSGSYLAQPDLTATYTYDGVDHVVQQVTSATGTSETLTSTSHYDLAGRIIDQTPAGLGTTSYTYNPTARTETVTAPATQTVASGSQNGTATKTYQLDGRLASVTGTAIVAQYYSYGVEVDWTQYTQVNIGTASSVRWQKSWTDCVGNGYKSQRRGFSQSSQADYFEQRTYDSNTGQLTQLAQTGRAPTLYQYNSLGQLTRSGLDVNNGGTLVLASNDRITDQDTSFFKDASSNWWTQTTTTSYPFASSATAITTSTSRSRLTGFGTNVQAESVTIDAEGNTTDSVTTVDRTNHLVTSSVTAPGLTNAQASVAYNGLSVKVTGFDGLSSYAQYDALGRPSKAIDTRSNATTTTYITNTTLVQTVTDAAGNPLSTTTYDGNDRVLTVQNALGKFTRTAYDTLGRVTNVWGSATYPVSYGYDATYGDKTSMSTYRGAPSTDSTTWPVVGTADTTTWTYDGPSGFLWKKTDAASQSVQFDYNARGLMASRQLARALVHSVGNVKATYTYDPATAELLSTTYNDSGEDFPTPSVTNTYTRSGQLLTINDATSASPTDNRVFTYDSTNPWRLNTETLPSFFGSPASSSRVVTRLYESTTSPSAGAFGSYTKGTVKGRAVGFDLGNGSTGGATTDLQQQYYFDNLGQFVGITSQVGTGTPQTFTYSYQSSSELLNGYTVGSNFAVTRSYETQRDVVTSIQTKWGASTVLSQFDFQYDSARRRQTSKMSGTAYGDYYAGLGYSSVYNLYAYNDRNEVQTSAMYKGDTASLTPAPTAELPSRRFEYRYDSIGNRQTSGETGKSVANGGTDDSYLANNLNEYTQKDNLTVRVIGTAVPAAHVAVAGATSTSKTDAAWGADIVPANSASAVQGNVTTYAALLGAGSGGKDIIGSSTKPFFVPKASQGFTYDADGNMTADTVWSYSYNAENQLVRATSILATGLGFTRLQLDFIYDYLGRRVQKKVTNLDTSVVTLTRRFIYDNWNLIAELDGTGANLQRSYTWGLDLTGDLTRAGGVGALVQMYDYASSKTFWPTYDSNGNTATLVNASTGAFGVVYEYDPYGNYLRADVTDSAVQDNPWRFSSKYADLESNLVYYGHRYYLPILGRFINRDPIEESGGLNLYGFCGNNPVNNWDYLGNLKLNGKRVNWGRDTMVPAMYHPTGGSRPTLNGGFEALTNQSFSYLSYLKGGGNIENETTNSTPSYAQIPNPDPSFISDSLNSDAQELGSDDSPDSNGQVLGSDGSPNTGTSPGSGITIQSIWQADEDATMASYYSGSTLLDTASGRTSPVQDSAYVDGAITESPGSLSQFAAGMAAAMRFYSGSQHFEDPGILFGRGDFLNNTVGPSNWGARIIQAAVGLLSTAVPEFAAESGSFFEGTSYTPKVLNQMADSSDLYHGFPSTIDTLESAGSVRTLTGGDGVVRDVLEIPGSVNNDGGVFQYIKNPDGTINHRLFVPRRP